VLSLCGQESLSVQLVWEEHTALLSVAVGEGEDLPSAEMDWPAG